MVAGRRAFQAKGMACINLKEACSRNGNEKNMDGAEWKKEWDQITLPGPKGLLFAKYLLIHLIFPSL